jgi:hypothetical protein
MGVRQTLKKELEESELWLSREKEESTYRRDLRKRIEQEQDENIKRELRKRNIVTILDNH